MNFTESNETFNAEFKDVQTLKGDRGYSAYEIAVQNGFEGTEAEWLESLHGADGKDGQNGKDGAKGDKGDTGAQGIQGVQGEKGEKGDKGDPYELTEADKTEIINGVLAAMPDGDGVAY